MSVTISEIADALRSGQLSSVELTDTLLARADRSDDQLGTFQSRFDAAARAAARAADRELAGGIDRGPLHGVPLVVKDVLTSREGPTTAGSRAAHSLDPSVDAGAVARLRQAGAVILGKVRTSELAIGMPHPPFRDPLNPWDPEAWVGGSSSGTAAAVAAGLAPAGLGSDTGGSIRIPSACCGTTGLKPTYGRVSRAGCVPLGFSLDTVGPIARTASDCALVLAAIAGFDPADPTSAPRPADGWSDLGDLAVDLDGLRVGVDPLTDHAADLVDPDQPHRFQAALDVLADAGARIQPVTLPHYRELRAADQVTLLAEGCAYHAQGFREDWTAFGPSARQRLGAGLLLTAVDYVHAQQVRRIGQRALAALLEEVDVIVTPTMVRAAPPAAAMAGPRHGAMPGVHTQYWNAVGLPTLSVPIGFNAAGLPLAMQVSGRPFEERRVLAVGHAYQHRTDWHRAVAPAAVEAAKPRPAPAPSPSAPVGVEIPAELVALLERAGVDAASEADLASLAGAFATLQESVACLAALAQQHPTEPALVWQVA